MQTYRIETIVAPDSTLTITDVPFPPGKHVEVVVHSSEHDEEHYVRYPLRGKPIRYHDPFESVAEDEWAVVP